MYNGHACKQQFPTWFSDEYPTEGCTAHKWKIKSNQNYWLMYNFGVNFAKCI